MSTNKGYYKIAGLVTCHNRKQKTIASLQSIYSALNVYNKTEERKIIIKLFLVDDGCTDGTPNDVTEKFKDKDIKIIQGNGNLFWAGGMRLAWGTAIKEKSSFDFYLLFNDDTEFDSCCFKELLKTHFIALNKFGKAGIYSGIISSFDKKIITYGGKVYAKGLLGKSISLLPTGKPQECAMTNANILLVSHNVVEEIGILDKKYIHSCADWAYGIEASKRGFPVLVTGNICGYCDNDHDTEEQERIKLTKMSLNKRKKYFSLPTHSTKDILTFMWNYNKTKFFLVRIARFLNYVYPKLYYSLSKRRSTRTKS